MNARYLFSLLIFCCLNPHAMHAGFSFSSTLTTDSAHNDSLSIQAGTRHIDGRLYVNKEIPDSWSLRLCPAPELTLILGSSSVSGFPSRMNRPAFSLTSPFFTPTVPTRERILSPADTVDTEALAAEINTSSWKTAFKTDTDGSTWLLVSRYAGLSGVSRPSLTLQLIAARILVPDKSDSSWFLPLNGRKAGEQAFGAYNFQWKKSFVSASFCGMSSFPKKGRISQALRFEATLYGRFADISAGYFTSDRAFQTIQGESLNTLQNGFISPILHLGRLFNPGILLDVSSVFFSEKRKQEKITESDTRQMGVYYGLRVQTETFRLRCEIKQQKKIETAKASVSFTLTSAHIDFWSITPAFSGAYSQDDSSLDKKAGFSINYGKSFGVSLTYAEYVNLALNTSSYGFDIGTTLCITTETDALSLSGTCSWIPSEMNPSATVKLKITLN